MASSTQHATLGRNVTISTDASLSNRCMYTDDRETRWPAVITATPDSNKIVVDLMVIDNTRKTTTMHYGVQHSIDHKNTNTWDWT